MLRLRRSKEDNQQSVYFARWSIDLFLLMHFSIFVDIVLVVLQYISLRVHNLRDRGEAKRMALFFLEWRSARVGCAFTLSSKAVHLK